jgi:glycosyltransferase involved in cell wall biosynthesis
MAFMAAAAPPSDTATRARRADAAAVAGDPAVEIVIPVYNEEHSLPSCIERLGAFMRGRLPLAYAITIADNASTDRTLEVAVALAERFAEVEVIHLDRKGRGGALREAWTASRADVVAYMDVDLSTDLACLPALVVPLVRGEGDVAIGSRLAPGSKVARGFKRELISRAYNVLLRVGLGVTFSDAQCGFKAARREVVLDLLGDVIDGEWFFDTELLYRAQRARYSVHEVPVRWVEDPDSRVDIVATALADLRGIWRLRREHAQERRGTRSGREAPATGAAAAAAVPSAASPLDASRPATA